MWSSVTDFGARNGTPLAGTADDWWPMSEPLHRLLADHAAEWWVAEETETGAIVGFARSIEREGLFELTEFFVVPGRQSAGLGRRLMDRAFPAGRGDVRSIIATTDTRALARYYAAGTFPQFPLLTLGGEPSRTEVPGDVVPASIDPVSEEDLDAVATLERAVLGHARGHVELRWLLGQREGYRYLRGGEDVGFAFVGAEGTGPIAALEPRDLPSVLLHVEDRAAALGVSSIEFQVPGPNEVAARHLLARGFRIDPWVNLLMASRPFGHFDRMIPFGPPIFL
jgi:GNAT superfamily N-acetyltransferase